MPTNIANDNLRKVIQLSYEMLELADRGDKFRQDIGCGVVFGTLRDEAYKIRRLAEEELSQHGHKPKPHPSRVEKGGAKEAEQKSSRSGKKRVTSTRKQP